MLSFRQGLPIVARAVIAGVAVAAAGTIPWTVLAGWNLRAFVQAPWAVLPMAAYLWLFWRYLDGAGWPQTTSELRRTSLRANRLSADIWGMALVAGLIGLAALLPLLGVMGRLGRLPAEGQPIDVPPQMPFVTVFVLLVMASTVAGVVEEAAFRGYMQTPIERLHGPVAAILVNGTLFGIGHYSHHPAQVFVMLPYYIAVAAVYGGLAYATNSILPGLALHAGGDVFSLTRLWTTGRPEWQVSAAPSPLVWETGLDAGFVLSAIGLVALGAAAIWMYSRLAIAARAERKSAPG